MPAKLGFRVRFNYGSRTQFLKHEHGRVNLLQKLPKNFSLADGFVPCGAAKTIDTTPIFSSQNFIDDSHLDAQQNLLDAKPFLAL